MIRLDMRRTLSRIMREGTKTRETKMNLTLSTYLKPSWDLIMEGFTITIDVQHEEATGASTLKAMVRTEDGSHFFLSFYSSSSVL